MSGVKIRRAPPEEQERAGQETAERLDRYFAQRGAADIKCPVCQTDQWAVAQDASFDAALILLTKDGQHITRPIAHVPVYVLFCQNCSFVRLHVKGDVDQVLGGDVNDAHKPTQ